MIKSKQGSERSVLIIAGVVVAILVAVFFVGVYNSLIRSAVLAESTTTSRDIATLLETTYAAPESLEVNYDIEMGITGDTEGLPVVGSLLIDAHGNEICTSQWTEDEMWVMILNRAQTAWAAGVAFKAGETVHDIRKSIIEFRKGLGRQNLNRIVFGMNRGSVIETYQDLLSQKQVNNLNHLDGIFDTDLPSRWHPIKQFREQKLKDIAGGMLMSEDAMGAVNKFTGSSDPKIATFFSNPQRLEELAEVSTKGGWEAGIKMKTYSWPDNVKKYVGKNLDDFANCPEAVSFAHNAGEFKKAGYLDDLVAITGTSDAVDAAGSISVALAKQLGLINKLQNTVEGYHLLNAIAGPKGATKLVARAELAMGRYWKFQRVRHAKLAGNQLRKIGQTADEAAAFAKFGKNAKTGQNAADFAEFLSTNKEVLAKVTKKGKRITEGIIKSPTVAGKLAGLTGDEIDVIKRFTKQYPDIAKDVYKGGSLRNTFRSTANIDDMAELYKEASKIEDARKLLNSPHKLRGLNQMTRWERLKQIVMRPIGRAINWLANTRAGIAIRTRIPKTTYFGKADAMADLGKQGIKVPTEGIIDATTAPRSLRTVMDADTRNLIKLQRNRVTGQITTKVLAKTSQKIGGGFKQGIKNALAMKGFAAPLDACSHLPPPAGTACKIGALALWGTFIAIDTVTTTYPFLLMIDQGHAASKEVRDKEVTCYSYAGSGKDIYADPPNCEPGVESVNVAWREIEEVDEWWGKALKGLDLIFGGFTFRPPEAICTEKTVITGGTLSRIGTSQSCSDVSGVCPNYYISYDSSWNLGPVGAGGILATALTGCTIAGQAYTTLGLACYATTYLTILGFIQANPGDTVAFLMGPNIFPKSKYYYMEWPTSINIYKDYNHKTGGSDLSIENA